MFENRAKLTKLQSKIDELVEVRSLYKDKLKRNDNVIPHMFLDTSKISEYDEGSIYEVISEGIIGKIDNMIFEYKVNDEPVKKQIRNIVYELSEKARYKAEFDGIFVLKLTADFIQADKENELLLQFIKEQGWYVVISARENVKEIFDWVSVKLFVDGVITVSSDDLSYASPVDVLKSYDININTKLSDGLDKYITTMRNKLFYDGKSEQVVMQNIVYNVLKFVVSNQGIGTKKVGTIEVLTRGINEKAIGEQKNKRQIGFQVEKGERDYD